MRSIAAYIVLFIILVSASVLWKKRFAYAAPIALICIILLQYTLGLFFGLSVAFYAVFVLSFACFILLVVHIVRFGWGDVRKNVLNYGLWAFLLSIVIILVLSRGRVCYITDEYSHWGTVVKNMLYFDRFGSIAQSSTAYKTYPPAGSLLPYFFARFYPQLDESSMYHGALLLTFTLMLPVFNSIKKGEIGRFLIIYGLTFFLPIVFFPYAYSTLYVDVQMALVFGSLLVLYFSSERFIQSKERWIIIGLYSGFLALLKPFGIGLALIAIFLYISYKAFSRKTRSNPIDSHHSRIIGYIAAIGIFIYCVVSWQINLAICGAKSLFMLHFSDSSGMISQMVNLSTEQLSTIQRFVMRHCAFIENGAVPFSVLTWILSLLGLGILAQQMSSNSEDTRSKPRISYVWILIAGYIVYAACLLVAYLFIFTQAEADYLASFDRYVFTYLLGAFVVVFWQFARQSDQRSLRILFLSLFVMIYLSVTPFLKFMSPGYSQEARAELGQMSFVSKTLDSTKDSVGMVFTDGIKTRAFSYLVAPVKSGFFWNAADTGDSVDRWAKKVESNCTYLYIDGTTPDFSAAYAALFPDGIEDRTLYHVAKQNGSVILQKVED